jgi:RNA polymerase sigma factor (sigma-70 family)
MHGRSDEQLMQAYAGGDMGAFERLYQRYRAPLYRYVLRQVREPATANDLFQEIWEKLVSARRRYRPAAPFRSWLFRIAHNHVVDHYRRARPAAGVAVESLAAGSPGPDNQLEQEHRAASLAQAIAELPPEQREVVLLRLESGLDIRAIAEICGIGPETAKSRLRYAVDKLKQRVGATEPIAAE